MPSWVWTNIYNEIKKGLVKFFAPNFKNENVIYKKVCYNKLCKRMHTMFPNCFQMVK